MQYSVGSVSGTHEAFVPLKTWKHFQHSRNVNLLSNVPIIILSGKSGNYQLLNEGLSVRNVEAKT